MEGCGEEPGHCALAWPVPPMCLPCPHKPFYSLVLVFFSVKRGRCALHLLQPSRVQVLRFQDQG